MKVQVAEPQSKGRTGRPGAAKSAAVRKGKRQEKPRAYSSDRRPPLRYTRTLEDERRWMDF